MTMMIENPAVGRIDKAASTWSAVLDDDGKDEEVDNDEDEKESENRQSCVHLLHCLHLPVVDENKRVTF